jgi:hypothetical protein
MSGLALTGRTLAVQVAQERGFARIDESFEGIPLYVRTLFPLILSVCVAPLAYACCLLIGPGVLTALVHRLLRCRRHGVFVLLLSYHRVLCESPRFTRGIDPREPKTI